MPYTSPHVRTVPRWPSTQELYQVVGHQGGPDAAETAGQQVPHEEEREEDQAQDDQEDGDAGTGLVVYSHRRSPQVSLPRSPRSCTASTMLPAMP